MKKNRWSVPPAALGSMGAFVLLSAAAAAFSPTNPARSLVAQVLPSGGFGGAQVLGAVERAVPSASKPRYDLSAAIDWELLTWKAQGRVEVPVPQGESLDEAVFFLFANADGVGGAGGNRKNIVVDKVSLAGRPLAWKLNGAVLRVALPQSQIRRFALDFEWHGVVPRSQNTGGLADMLGGMGSMDIDLGAIMGGAPSKAPAPAKPQNTDYGLYSAANNIMSLGSFWYPTLAVRQNGRWIDEAPEGLGDVAFADVSDYRVRLELPPQVLVAAPGRESKDGSARVWELENARDFAVVASDGFTRQAKSFDIGGRRVLVESFAIKTQDPQRGAKARRAVDVAGRALQSFSKRFGAYPYDRFVVAEGPMRAGAGGMEYSGMTAIASMLYDDLGAQLKEFAQSLGGGLGLGGGGAGGGPLGDLLGDLEKEAYGETSTQAAVPDAPQAEGENPAADLLGGILGQQQGMLETMFETTLAHEVAHQWWAIGVGSDSQRAPWVDESLTNYSAMLYYEDLYGRPKAQQIMDLHLVGAYSTARMMGAPDAPVNKRTSGYAGNVQYGAVVYGKGALFYDRLRQLVGDEAFFGALRRYYALYQFRLASGNDLARLMGEAAPAKRPQIAALYKRWIEGAHGDDDITGGKAPNIADLLGGILGGAGSLGDDVGNE
jgi:hypothetical protein